MAKNFRGCGENLALDLFPLGGGLDNDIGTGHRVQLHDRLDTGQGRVGRLPVDLFLVDQSRQLLGDAGLAAFGNLEADVRQIDMIACLCRNLCDTGTHLSRSDYANCFHSMPFALFLVISQATSDCRANWLDCKYAPDHIHSWPVCRRRHNRRLAGATAG